LAQGVAAAAVIIDAACSWRTEWSPQAIQLLVDVLICFWSRQIVKCN